MQKIINQYLISYKTVVRTYNEITPDNKEVLTRQKEIIITDVQTTQKNVFYLTKLTDVLLVTLESLLLSVTTKLNM